MTNERAIEILNPEHREHYDSLETVNEACRMGMDALKYRTPKKPKHTEYSYSKILEYRCPSCNAHLGHSTSLSLCTKNFCGSCGQALDWSKIKPDYKKANEIKRSLMTRYKSRR